MKTLNQLRVYSAFFIALLVLPACSQQSKDAELKADITVKAKTDVNFSGVLFTVDKGNVILSGNCPTTTSREKVKQLLSTIHMIKNVEDHLTIAPVILGSSFTVKQQVDSVLSKYPGITAVVSDTAVVLQGKIKTAELEKLLPSLVKLYPKVVTEYLKKEI